MEAIRAEMVTVQQARVSSGIPGLDEILEGGFITGRSYLVTGPPGTGKTTIGWHFLTAAGDEEPALFITLGSPSASCGPMPPTRDSCCATSISWTSAPPPAPS